MPGNIGGIAAGAMRLFQMGMATLANNIANKQTFGFHAQRLVFTNAPFIHQQPGGFGVHAGRMNPVGAQLGTGVNLSAIDHDQSVGDPQQTGNPFDLCISGTGIGFFKIQLPDENRRVGYKRAGNFTLNSERQIVTLEGYVLDEGINVPQEAIETTIDETGTIWIKVPGDDKLQNVGQLKLYTFANPHGLEYIENNLLLATEASGEEREGTPGSLGFGTIKQGFIENSNVNSISQVAQMIELSQNHGLLAEALKTDRRMKEDEIGVASSA